jgi:hypothetical protein
MRIPFSLAAELAGPSLFGDQHLQHTTAFMRMWYMSMVQQSNLLMYSTSKRIAGSSLSYIVHQ